jgi:type IV secretion system protein VirB6
MSCQGIVEADFLGSALRFADCQAQTIGMQGYLGLAASSSPAQLLLSGLLTLLVALFGYRMLLGHVPDVREGVLTFVKVGIVLALATSWAAYRVILYDVALQGPSEIVASVGAPAGIPGATGGLIDRLAAVDKSMIELNRLGMTGLPLAPVDGNTSDDAGNAQIPSPAYDRYAYEPGTIFGTSSLGTGRLVFLTATLAAYAAVRLVAGLLLAIGPLFILFLLFDGTRSLFEGWMRALIASVVGALAVTMILGVELALLEPWLTDILLRRQIGQASAATPTELLVLCLTFALILLAGLGMSARVARAFRFPRASGFQASMPAQALGNVGPVRVTGIGEPATPGGTPSRATALAEAIATTQRREQQSLLVRSTPAGYRLTPASSGENASSPSSASGRSDRRRTHSRVSASARKRDVKP